MPDPSKHIKLAIVGHYAASDSYYQEFCRKIDEWLGRQDIHYSDIDYMLTAGNCESAIIPLGDMNSMALRWAQSHNIQTKVIACGPSLDDQERQGHEIAKECSHLIAFPAEYGYRVTQAIDHAVELNKHTRVFWVTADEIHP